jgi:hypothetical protein
VSPVQGVRTLCLEVQQSYPEIEEEVSEPIGETVQRILDGMGLQVVATGTPCDATLTVALTGEPVGTSYENTPGECYGGAEVNGQMTFTVPGRAPLTLPISGEVSTPLLVTICADRTEAPFGKAWPMAVLNGLAEVWGIQTLVHALGDEDEYVSQAAARSLGNIGPEEGVVPALIQTMEEHEDPDARASAAEALGKMGPEEGVVPALIQALDDVQILTDRRIGPPEWWSVREAAAKALGEIGPEAVEAVPALIGVLSNKDESQSLSVSWATQDALRAITGQEFGEDAGRWRQWWEGQQ